MPPMLDQTTPGKKKTHPPKKMGQEDEEDALYRSLPKNIQPQKPAIETGEPTRLSFCRYEFVAHHAPALDPPRNGLLHRVRLTSAP
jgi:hypothetical protein